MVRTLILLVSWFGSTLVGVAAPVPRALNEKKPKAAKDDEKDEEDGGVSEGEGANEGASGRDADNEPRPVYFFEPTDDKKPPRVILRAQSLSMDASRPSVLKKLRQQPKGSAFQKQPATIPNK